jgi:electron transport complex protein RnfE
MGIGLTVGLLALGIPREFFGAGSLFGFELLRDSAPHLLIMIMAPGAFFTLGLIIMIRKYIRTRTGRKV